MGKRTRNIRRGKECPYCGQPTEYKDSACIYGKSYGMIYICEPCDAYCGVHKGTNKSLGKVANYELREARKLAHKVFDRLWKEGSLKRKEAYYLLQEKLDLRADLAHIGMMNLEQCQKVINIFTKYQLNK